MNQKGVLEVAAGFLAGKQQVKPRTDLNFGGERLACNPWGREWILTAEKNLPGRRKDSQVGISGREWPTRIGQDPPVLEDGAQEIRWKWDCQGFSVRTSRLGHVYAW